MTIPRETHLFSYAIILRIKKGIEVETVRLHPDDDEAICVLVEGLRRQSFLLGFEAKSDPAPPGSSLESDTSSLMGQTKRRQKT